MPALSGVGCVENELGLRKFLEERGHEYVVTDSKDGEGNDLDKHLPDTDIVSPIFLAESSGTSNLLLDIGPAVAPS